MKKKMIMAIISFCLAAGLCAGALACRTNGNANGQTSEENVCYYGCPNSKKVKKLNLKKKKMK